MGCHCLLRCKGVKVVIYLGSLVQLCCWEGRTLQVNITGVCGVCLQCLGHTGFAPSHSVCAFPVYTAQAPGCPAEELSKGGPGLHALPWSRPLRFRFSGTPQSQTRLGLHFVPFPGPSSSGDQVLEECNTPVFLPREFHGQRSLVGYSPWGHRESDATEN